ncbi:hypothetical protein FACS1894201_01610 [Bacteroidia bacterium]|nr:hypothetical protein FACS1894201_01610 [Bacteroidia bacterium]
MGQENNRRNYVSIVLALLLVLSLVLTFTCRHQKKVAEQESVRIQSELEQIVVQHNIAKVQNVKYSEQLAERDSVIRNNTKEIQRLISIQTDYRKLQKKLDMLRQITQDYVVRLDSLIVINQELEDENRVIKQELLSERQKNNQLETVKTQLDNQLAQASTLKAHNVNLTGVRMRGTEEIAVERADRIERIKVQFTLVGSDIIPAGNYPLYVRLVRSDGQILTRSDNDVVVINDINLQYSIRENINYNNKDQDISLYFDKLNTTFSAGTYYVYLFMNGAEIGMATLHVDQK